jgi:hypothetical protein
MNQTGQCGYIFFSTVCENIYVLHVEYVESTSVSSFRSAAAPMMAGRPEEQAANLHYTEMDGIVPYANNSMCDYKPHVEMHFQQASGPTHMLANAHV